jgi:predicted nucleic acid-binding protein
VATLIDSSVLIAVERGNLDLHGLLARHGDSEVLLSSVTVAELLHGVYRARTVEQRTRRENIIEQWLADFPVVAFDLAIARVHAPLGAHLASRGVIVGAHDLQIAATALAIDASLATRDERSFPKIRGLKLLRW